MSSVAASAQPLAKYVPVHRRMHEAASRRSTSPALSDATLVAPEPPSPKSQVYSITTLLHLAHDPEIKLVSMVQREKIRETSPEIVMSRKMRKSLEFNAIQERLRVRALAQPTENIRASDHPHSTPSKSSLKLPQQPQRQHLRAKRQPSPNKAMEEASWRIFRLPFVAV